ncbi:helix-turn-helix domain-containing protein [Paenibacillus rubinfantis]|uniref:helix-turn-helix domain-containing protein n=1 Tax=Paenibacillus rubinfantis TaxID=1720296 RepID=UPI00073F9972|nr:helix-turn-helix domain-containing protein [Paenibacillus rubinfantis]
MDESIYEKAYTIKEFSELTGVPQNTLRNWEEKLGEAFVVPRDPHENRFYTDRHLELVRLIQKWRDSEYELSFTQIKQMLLHMQEAGPTTRSFSPPTDGEGGSNSLVAVSQSGGQAIQLQEMQQLVVGMEQRMQQFFGQLDQVLQKHAESTQEFVRSEIESLKASQDQRDEKIIHEIETKIQEKLNVEQEQIVQNVQSIKEELKSHVAASSAGAKEQLEELMASAKSEIQQQMKDQMSEWAVISRNELGGLAKKKKRGFFGLFGGGD